MGFLLGSDLHNITQESGIIPYKVYVSATVWDYLNLAVRNCEYIITQRERSTLFGWGNPRTEKLLFLKCWDLDYTFNLTRSITGNSVRQNYPNIVKWEKMKLTELSKSRQKNKKKNQSKPNKKL